MKILPPAISKKAAHLSKISPLSVLTLNRNNIFFATCIKSYSCADEKKFLEKLFQEQKGKKEVES